MPKAKARPTTKEPLDTLVVLSDLHCGSTVALMPPNFKTDEGLQLCPSDAQTWLWLAWSTMLADIEVATRGKRWALLLNGDLIEGIHHRSVQVISADVGDHVACALEVLQPLASLASTVLVTRGTECHTHGTEEAIARRLGSRVAPCGRHAPDRWELIIGGVPVVARHHLPATTRRALEGSQLSIQLAEEQAQAAGAGRIIPRVLLGAHRHVAGIYERPGQGMCVVTPPWQLLTRFGHKVVPAAANSLQVGCAILRFPGEGELPTASVLTYEPPQPEPLRL